MKKHGRACGEREGVFFGECKKGEKKRGKKKKKKKVIF